MDEMRTITAVRAAAAYHEAGHAAVAFLHGVIPRRISVAQDSRGRLICNQGTLTVESETMIAMSGLASEHLNRNPDDKELPTFAEFVTSHDALWSKKTAKMPKSTRSRFSRRNGIAFENSTVSGLGRCCGHVGKASGPLLPRLWSTKL
jgi:hypothetical protein